VLKPAATPGPYLTVEAAQKAGAVTLNYGILINNMVSFIIVAFAVFLLVRGINRMRREEIKAPAPAAPPEEVALLREIRDSLRR
jgi:large conductance mechanosensitive channel